MSELEKQIVFVIPENEDGDTYISGFFDMEKTDADEVRITVDIPNGIKVDGWVSLSYLKILLEKANILPSNQVEKTEG